MIRGSLFRHAVLKECKHYEPKLFPAFFLLYLSLSTPLIITLAALLTGVAVWLNFWSIMLSCCAAVTKRGRPMICVHPHPEWIIFTVKMLGVLVVAFTRTTQDAFLVGFYCIDKYCALYFIVCV